MVFDFFKLPQELQDQCYREMHLPQIGLPSRKERERELEHLVDFHDDSDNDLATWTKDFESMINRLSVKGEDPSLEKCSRISLNKAPYASIQVTNVPDSRLLSINKQFREEYISAAKHMSLHIKQMDKDTSTDIAIPKAMHRMKSIYTNFLVDRHAHIGSGEVRRQFERVQDVLFNLLQQLHKPEIYLQAKLITRDNLDDCKQRVHSEQRLLTRIVGLKELTVRAHVRVQQVQALHPSSPEVDRETDVFKFNYKMKKLEESKSKGRAALR